MNKKQIELVKDLVADTLLSQIQSTLECFSVSDIDQVMFDRISRLKAQEICAVTGVGTGMAHKYKSGENLPPLDKAVLLEEHFNIPPKYWVALKKRTESK